MPTTKRPRNPLMPEDHLTQKVFVPVNDVLDDRKTRPLPMMTLAIKDPQDCHSGVGRNLFKNGRGLPKDPGLRRDDRRLPIQLPD